MSEGIEKAKENKANIIVPIVIFGSIVVLTAGVIILGMIGKNAKCNELKEAAAGAGHNGAFVFFEDGEDRPSEVTIEKLEGSTVTVDSKGRSICLDTEGGDDGSDDEETCPGEPLEVTEKMIKDWIQSAKSQRTNVPINDEVSSDRRYLVFSNGVTKVNSREDVLDAVKTFRLGDGKDYGALAAIGFDATGNVVGEVVLDTYKPSLNMMVVHKKNVCGGKKYKLYIGDYKEHLYSIDEIRNVYEELPEVDSLLSVSKSNWVQALKYLSGSYSSIGSSIQVLTDGALDIPQINVEVHNDEAIARGGSKEWREDTNELLIKLRLSGYYDASKEGYEQFLEDVNGKDSGYNSRLGHIWLKTGEEKERVEKCISEKGARGCDDRPRLDGVGGQVDAESIFEGYYADHLSDVRIPKNSGVCVRLVGDNESPWGNMFADVLGSAGFVNCK